MQKKKLTKKLDTLMSKRIKESPYPFRGTILSPSIFSQAEPYSREEQGEDKNDFLTARIRAQFKERKPFCGTLGRLARNV